MTEHKSKDLGSGSIGKLLFSLAVPTVTAQLVNMLYNIVDRMYIGHIPEIGAAALTGVGVTFPILMLISAFSSLVGTGGAPLASIKMGKGDNKGAEKILGNCMALLLVISVCLTVIFLVFQEELLLLFGASENTLPYAKGYLSIYVCGTVFVQLSLGLNSFITAQGFTKVSMMTVVIGAFINLVLDPVFIFVFNMGVQGAAIATVISQLVSSVWVVKFLLGERTALKIRRCNLKLELKVILPALGLGLAPFIMQSTDCLMNVAYNSSFQKYGGDIAVGAMTVQTSLMQFLILPIVGICQAAQPITGFNYGAGNAARVKKTFQLMLISCVIYAVLFWGSLMSFPKVFISIFTNDPNLIEMASWAVRIYLGAAVVLGVQISCQNMFLALGQSKSSLFLALLRKVVLIIPLIYILPNFFEDKVFAVCLSGPISDVLATLAAVILFAIQFRGILNKMEARNRPEEVWEG